MFSQSKAKPYMTNDQSNAAALKPNATATAGNSSQEIVSTLGPGIRIDGDVTCTGAMHIFGRVIGDIHAARLLVCKGARVEGNVTALEVIIDGAFKGTLSGNNVKLQAAAVVDGEIFHRSLTIEQNANFEGTARRLAAAVEAPAHERIRGEAPAARLVPKSFDETRRTNGAAIMETAQQSVLLVG